MLRYLIGVLFVLGMSTHADAVVYVMEDGRLSGLRWLEVDSGIIGGDTVYYDVDFEAGECSDHFDCRSGNNTSEAANFSFRVARALGEVLVDNSFGAFDSDPSLIEGCAVGSACWILPNPGLYEIGGYDEPGYNVIYWYNAIPPEEDGFRLFDNGGHTLSLPDWMNYTWAVTTPATGLPPAVVPLPGGYLLYGTGLLLLGALRIGRVRGHTAAGSFHLDPART